MRLSAIATAVLTVFVLLSCGDRHAGGNSAETGNPEFSMQLVLTNGYPAAGARVWCLPADYDPRFDGQEDIIAIGEADTLGQVLLELDKSQICNLEAFHASSGAKLLVYATELDIGDELIDSAAQYTLRSPGSLIWVVPDSSGFAEGDTIEYFASGTSIAGQAVVLNGAIFLEGLPAGRVDSLMVVHTQNEPVLVRSTVNVEPGLPVRVDSLPIAASWFFPLNTSYTGVALKESLVGLPLALRLDGSQIDFRLIAPGRGSFSASRVVNSQGKDSLLRDSLGLSLTVWDTISQRAVFWVRLDSLLPLSASQGLVLTYHETAMDVDSNMSQGQLPLAYGGVSPFAPIDGYVGAWHFDEGIARVLDASGTHLPADAFKVQSEDGAIGKGFWFDGRASFVSIPNSDTGSLDFAPMAPRHFSVWVRLDATNTSRHILGKGHLQYYLKYYYPNQWLYDESNLGDPNEQTWLIAPYDNLTDSGTWIHLTLNQDSAGVPTMVVNGNPVQSTPGNNQSVDLRYTSVPFEIGRRLLQDGSAGQHFWGVIDEVHVSKVARSESWSRLVFLNQNRTSVWPKALQRSP